MGRFELFFLLPNGETLSFVYASARRCHSALLDVTHSLVIAGQTPTMLRLVDCGECVADYHADALSYIESRYFGVAL